MANGSFWSVTLTMMFLGSTSMFFAAFCYPDWFHNEAYEFGLWWRPPCDPKAKACRQLRCEETPYDEDWCWCWAAAIMCLGLVCCVVSVAAFCFWLHVSMSGHKQHIQRGSRYVAQLAFLFTAGFDAAVIFTLTVGLSEMPNGYGFYFVISNFVLNLCLFLLLLLTGPQFALED
ncbi:hypothetical protein CAPTEDRAFT_186185 [Capitella teleta]|uniref:Uncharacterized protein n=1 Tax=Capitella teleta TaxID=283909 RepID=R7UBZ4_CAPTE|nr:hypothetical protein CAPTEDRAFT_186185 [Capitella teleta]|eukprot:ELU03631.1 hypothetical protein CAPTEDRAFT_186185 [Capitella teleta]